jgi:hypothetical protein
MARQIRTDLPDAEWVWQRVQAFAEGCKERNEPVPTLQKKILNYIGEVRAQTITRRSDAGREHTAHIEYGHIELIWSELLKNGYASTRGHPRVFAHALLHAAMRDCIDARGNEIHLRDLPPGTQIGIINSSGAVDYAARVSRFFGNDGFGGERALHRGIRLFIHGCPDAALVGLAGAPWEACHTEYVLQTMDRVDVVLRDGEGRIVLVEVKSRLCTDREYSRLQLDRSKARAIAPFAQAAKYRTQWHILYGTPLESIRCIVAAPEIPDELADTMRHRHQIESIAVTLPSAGPHALDGDD